jgi:hypothetical protein
MIQQNTLFCCSVPILGKIVASFVEAENFQIGIPPVVNTFTFIIVLYTTTIA